MEKKIKEHIMDDIFCDRPFDENDWDSFMKNSALEFPDNFQVCQEYELDNARDIRGLMQSKYDDLIRLAESILPKNIYVVEQFDVWFSDSSKVVFGMFDTYKKALNEMKLGFEKLYPGFNADIYENGANQWISDRFEFGVMISELPINVFDEV